MLADIMGNHVQVGLVGLTLAVQANNDGRAVLIAIIGSQKQNCSDARQSRAYPGIRAATTLWLLASKLPENIKSLG